MKTHPIIAGILLLATPAMAGDLTGAPRILDGDTIQIEGTKIRLRGIDAPEKTQVCLDPAVEIWACGVTARDELIAHVGDRPWTCHIDGTDHFRRSLATCEVDGEDIQRWMVRSGWALSFVRYSHAYDADEAMARNAQAGMWVGAFIAPWNWRNRNDKTVILGATSVPVNAQAILLKPVKVHRSRAGAGWK
jgi:endonuclease YncB( thermonuclease family)